MIRNGHIALVAMATAIMLLLAGCQQEDRPFVVSKIQAAAKLATCETTIDKIVLATEQKKVIKWLGGKKQAVFLAYSQATVKTGIDLDKLTRDDIKILEKSITINLPSVEVINFSYPSEKFVIDSLITERTLFDNITIQEQEVLYREAEADIRANLQYLGIRQATEEKTRKLMEGLLRNLGYEEIYITFKKEEMIYQINLTGDSDAPEADKGKKKPKKDQ